MTCTIRPYHPDDLEAILSAWEKASRLAHPFVSEDFLDEERRNIPALYLPNADTWVVEVDGAVVGFIALIGNEVGGLFVDPAFHGIGAGRRLMDKAASLHPVLEVQVYKQNHIGLTFYQRYGFQPMTETLCERTGLPLLRLRLSDTSNISI